MPEPEQGLLYTDPATSSNSEMPAAAGRNPPREYGGVGPAAAAVTEPGFLPGRPGSAEGCRL